MRDIFKLQDQIVESLITTLGLQLSLLEEGAVVAQHTKNLEAYDYFPRGLEDWFLTTTPEGSAKARKMFEKSVELGLCGRLCCARLFGFHSLWLAMG
jgi:hypothetical protein